MSKNTAYLYSYLIAFLYVGAGTLSVLSMYPDNLLYGEWVLWGLLLTLPANVISFGILYAEPPHQLTIIVVVILIQIIIFLLIGKLLFKLLFKKQVTNT